MDQINNALSILDKNKYVIATLIVVLIAYAAVIAPNIPEKYIMWIENPIAKIIVFLLIVLVASKNVTIAILLAIGYMISLHRLSSYIIKKKVAKVATKPVAVVTTPSVMRPVVKEIDSGNVAASVHPTQLDAMHDGKPDPADCVKKVKFRDFPYPQIVNMDPSAYVAKDDIESVQPYNDKPDLAEY